MNWPFVTLSRYLRDQAAAALKYTHAAAQLEAAEARATHAQAEADRYRGYYERLVDDVLMRRGETSGPTHEEPKLASDPVINQVAKVAGLVGNFQGAPITGPRHAATHRR